MKKNLLILLLLLVFSFGFVSAYTCSDSDGLNFLNKGTGTLSQVHEDYCLGRFSEKTWDYFCNGSIIKKNDWFV